MLATDHPVTVVPSRTPPTTSALLAAEAVRTADAVRRRTRRAATAAEPAGEAR
jgi:hypothetical protein